MSNWIDEPEQKTIRNIAKKLALFYAGNADLIATRNMPFIVRGNIRLIEDPKLTAPLWYFFIEEARAILEMTDPEL